MTRVVIGGRGSEIARREGSKAGCAVGCEEVILVRANLRFVDPLGSSTNRAQRLFTVRAASANRVGVSTEAASSTREATTDEDARTVSTGRGIKFQKRKSCRRSYGGWYILRTSPFTSISGKSYRNFGR